MADDKKDFFKQFCIKRDSEEKKKAAIPFLQMLKNFGLISDDDEEITEDKINALRAQLDAILTAYELNEGRAKAYEKACNEGSFSSLKEFLQWCELEDDRPSLEEKKKAYDEEVANLKDKYKSNENDSQYLVEIKALEVDERFSKYFKTQKKAKDNEEKLVEKFGNVDSVYGLVQEFTNIVDMPNEVWGDLLKLKKQNEEAFNQAYDDYFSSSPNFQSKYVKRADGSDAYDEHSKRIIENQHHYRYDKDNGLIHTIYNLEGTGLAVTWIKDNLGLASHVSSLTPAQLEALHRYCEEKGISITDFLDLGKLSVKEGGKDLGTVKDYWEKNFGDGQREGPANENEDTGPSVEGVSEAKAAYDTLSKGLNGGVSRLSFDEVLTEPDLDVTRNKLVSSAEFRSGLMGNYNPSLTKFRFGWNSTIISVYASENDKLVDGERDKNGRRTQTKKFAIELRHTVPPTARIYMGTDKDFTADHARLALDGMKKSGCLYFMLPPPDKIGGKKAMGAWMKACVKTGMIPICKTAETPDGVVLGAADLHAIKEAFDEEIKTGQLGTKDKIVFMMRLSQQLERQEEYRRSQDPNYRTHSSVQTKMEYFKQAPYFEMFQSSHLQKLEEYITEGMEKYGWDDIDKTAAIYALGHVIKDLAEGKVNGKPVDPLKVSEEDFKKALVFYQTMEKPRAVKTIFDAVKKFDNETVRENVVESSFNRAVNQEIKNAEAYLKQVCSTVQKNTTIEIKPEIDGRRRAVDRYEYQQSEEKKWDTTHSAEYKDLVKDVKAYGKEQKNRSSSGKSTESFEEWKKRMSGHSAGGYDGRAR